MLGEVHFVIDSEGVIIVGAGGHAKVIIELFAAGAKNRVVGLIDNAKSGAVLDIPIVGTDADLRRLRCSGVERAFVALGDNERRVAMGRHLQGCGFQIVNAISPTAIISPSVTVGTGIAIMAGAVINAECQIEDFAIINTGAVVDHDGHVGEGSHIAPGCTLAGSVKIGRLAFIGTGTSIIPSISVGDEAIVGAGACVIRNIPARMSAIGVPARILHDRRSPQKDVASNRSEPCP
jgi:UDP-perosamine 4-acetyltransferase